jgi:branched-chain amino acid transport system substrate-binding protein
MNKQYLPTIVIAISLILGACTPSATATAPAILVPATEATSEPIKIATCGPITGDGAIWGTQQQQGVQLAIDDINANGGLLGRKVELVPFDDKGDAKEAVSVAQRIVDDQTIVAVIGHMYSSLSKAAGPIYTKGKIPMVAVAATNPAVVTVGGEYVFRINLSDAAAGADMAVYTVQKLNKKRIAVLMDQTDYSQGVYDAYSAKATELGAEIVSLQKFVGGQDKDFTVMLTTIMGTNPDVILADGYQAEAALIAQQMKTLGIDVTLEIPDGATDPTYLELAGDAAEGTIAFSYYNPTLQDPKIEDLKMKYKAKYNGELLTYVPYAYDAMMAIADAIKIAGGTDRTAIRDALEKVNDPNGVTGPISFVNRDRAVGWSVVLKVQDGKFVFVEKSR